MAFLQGSALTRGKIQIKEKKQNKHLKFEQSTMLSSFLQGPAVKKGKEPKSTQQLPASPLFPIRENPAVARAPWALPAPGARSSGCPRPTSPRSPRASEPRWCVNGSPWNRKKRLDFLGVGNGKSLHYPANRWHMYKVFLSHLSAG